VKLFEHYNQNWSGFYSLLWRVQIMEISCLGVPREKNVGNRWSRELLSIHHNQQIQNISLIHYSKTQYAMYIYERNSFQHFTPHCLIALNGVTFYNANMLSSFLTCQQKNGLSLPCAVKSHFHKQIQKERDSKNFSTFKFRLNMIFFCDHGSNFPFDPYYSRLILFLL
jgi:hypothetical protein